MSIYPNPTSDDYINLAFLSSTSKKVDISIVDMQGKIIKSYEVLLTKGNNTVKVDITNISAGTYLFYIKHDLEKYETSSFIIK